MRPPLRIATVVCCAVGLLAASVSMPARAQSVSTLYDDPTQWRQVLSSPRPGGRLTAVTVDWDQPNKVYVGTQEASVLISNDGGLTWQEFSLTHRMVEERSAGGPALPPPNLGPSSSFIGGNVYDRGGDAFSGGGVDVLGLRTGGAGTASSLARISQGEATSFGRLPAPQGGLLAADRVPDFSTETRGISGGGIHTNAMRFSRRGDNFESVIPPRTAEVEPVVRVILCPSARYPLIVATNRSVFGSTDERTFVRLYSGNVPNSLAAVYNPFITDVDCSPVDTNELIISTSDGFVKSRDGGLTFEFHINGTSAGDATALSYDLAGAAMSEGPAMVLAANATFMFIGDPNAREGLEYVYPDFGDPNNFPYDVIRWITTTPSGQIWLATDSGVRASLDGGNTWKQAGFAYFGRDPIVQVEWNVTVGDRERLLVVTRDRIWATDDSGDSWFPLFAGFTRREIRQIAPAPPGPDGRGRWWVVTSGEVWTMDEPPATAAEPDDALRRWAARRFSASTLTQCMDDALSNLGLDWPHVESLFSSARRSRLFPVLDVGFYWERDDVTRSLLRAGAGPFVNTSSRTFATWEIFATLTWALPDTVYTNLVMPREQLYQLRKQIGFVVEDSFNEREMHLLRLASGNVGPVDAEILRTRIETLETVLETWMGHPMPGSPDDAR